VKLIRHISLLFLLALLPAGSSAQGKTPVRYDSAAMQLRQPSEETRRDIQESGDYAYDKDAGPEDPTIFERFFSWMLDKIWSASTTRTGVNVWQIIFIALAVLILVGIVLLLTRTDIRTIFFSPKQDGAATGKSSEFQLDIHGVDFPGRIAEALRAGDYRMAVRLQFLAALKQLSDKGFIAWRIDKTNHDYYLQLSGKPQQAAFGELSRLHEYIWYGDFRVEKQDYEQAEKQFKAFVQTL